VVVDPLPRRRHRRFRPELLNRLETLLAGTPEDLLLAELDRRGPLPVKTLIEQGGLPSGAAANALEQLLNKGEVFILADALAGAGGGLLGDLSKAKGLVTSRGGWATLLGQIKTTLADYHERFPLRVGMPRGELKSRLKLETRLFNEAIQRGQAEEALAATESSVRLWQHQVRFSLQQQTTINKLLTEFRGNPYNTPLPREVGATLGEDVMLALVEGGQLMLLSKEVVLLSETYHEFVSWLKDYLHQNKTVNVAQVRDAFNTSRKYALALLEYTDEQRLTKRVGDERVLRE
jgi:selenocysteine-specific elongation factor